MKKIPAEAVTKFLENGLYEVYGFTPYFSLVESLTY